MKIEEVREYIEKSEIRNFMIKGAAKQYPVYFKVNTLGGITIQIDGVKTTLDDSYDDKEMIRLRNKLCELYGTPEEE
jgi:uncharacterized protein with HEPN domain